MGSKLLLGALLVLAGCADPTSNITHTVTFNTNGGSSVSSQEVAEGGYATQPNTPTKNGYVFKGWYADSGLSQVWNFGSDAVNNPLTLYAKWEVETVTTHTVTFNTNGGSSVSSQEVAEGGYATQPNTPTKNGYVFKGWYADSGLSQVWNFGSDAVNNPLTLYAKWEEGYAIGATGPAGGKVFYDKGSYSNGWRYLEAAPSDTARAIGWGGSGTLVDTSTAIGTGKANTEASVAKLGSGNYAARVCYDLELGGYDDWFLPSKGELNELYKQKNTVGGFSSDYYWSSSEAEAERIDPPWNAWMQGFGIGRQHIHGKFGELKVRAVRAF